MTSRLTMTEPAKTKEKSAALTKQSSSLEEDPLTLNKIMKTLGSTGAAKANSEGGSSHGGNNSDNSALVSIGNTSFGFNFDSEEAMSGNSKEGQNDSSNDDSNDDSDGNGQSDAKVPASGKKRGGPQHVGSSNVALKSSVSSITSSSNSNLGSSSKDEAAANAVAGLESLARSYPSQKSSSDSSSTNDRKRKAPARSDTDDADNNDSGGYDTDNGDLESNAPDTSRSPSRITSSASGETKTKAEQMPPVARKKKKTDERKREERNQREKERSFRISKQIGELRNLLSRGGVIVPKGTKSSVLTEAANYIRMLQQHQYKSEIDRQQLVQQMQLIGRGAHGAQAAAAVRHVAAQNGVWSLGNFGGVPPKSAMSFYEAPSNEGAAAQNDHLQDLNALQQHKVDPNEYRYVFNSCGAGMAIASMGGAFIDCNTLFCQLSNYTKQELCSLTIFNLTARHDLQQAFDQISRLISPPMDAMRSQERPNPIVVRGKMKDRDDLGLSISLVKGDDGIAKCFCVTLVKNPTSPFDTSKPVPVSFDSIRQQKESTTQAAAAPKSAAGMKTAPAFTSG